jgi:hypothetical protein
MAHGGTGPGLGTTIGSRDWEKATLFAFGTFFFIVILAIAWLDRTPTKSSWYIYLCVLAMAAGGVAALLPGAIAVKLSPGIRASGAIAVAVLVIYFGKDKVTDDTIVQGLTSTLDPFQVPGVDSEGKPRTDIVNVDPESDVYVVINSKLAVYDQRVSGPRDLNFGANEWKGVKQAFVRRKGSSGIQIEYGALAQGDRIFVICKEPSGDWEISNDMKVPEGEVAMRRISFVAVKASVENGH